MHAIRSLAKASGATTQTIVNIEAGRGVPTFATIKRLAGALGVTPGEVEEFREAIKVRGEARR